MGQFVVGDIVVVKFPYSDLKGYKLRPALVVSHGEFNNLILCQITSKSYSSKLATPITEKDFENGGLSITSYVRPDKIFTADPALIQKRAGKLKAINCRDILQQVRELFSDSRLQ